MHCVVTGATGCLGLNLTQRLVADGYDVLALGRNEALGEKISSFGATFISIDLKEKERLRALMKDTNIIFHCAALSTPWGRYSDFYNTNVIGTQHIIDATPASARFVHVSSPSIYFDFKERHNIKETVPLPTMPANHYVKSKRLAESLIDEAVYERNLNAITLRPRAIFGPYDRAIFPRLLQSEKKGVLPLIGVGDNVIDITYVDNVVESLMLAATADNRCIGKKYNITNGQPMELLKIISLLYEALHKPLLTKAIPYWLAKKIACGLELIYNLPFMHHAEPALTSYSAGVLALGQTLNIDAAREELKYQPVVTLEEGIHRFAAWYTSQ